MLYVILDSGHNEQTAGKRSADGRILEYEYTYRLVAEVMLRLQSENGIRVVHLDSDKRRNGATDAIELLNRVKKANGLAKQVFDNKQDKIILISVHLDAGKETAYGATVWTSPAAGIESLKLANFVCDSIRAHRLEGNRSGLKHNAKFAIVHKTICPAVLVECAFMTNEGDKRMMLSDEGFDNICSMLCKSILDYYHSL